MSKRDIDTVCIKKIINALYISSIVEISSPAFQSRFAQARYIFGECIFYYAVINHVVILSIYIYRMKRTVFCCKGKEIYFSCIICNDRH